MENSEAKLRKLLDNLNKIGIAISVEKDVNVLLEKILEESIKITDSDGGSLYIKEEYEGEQYLKFKCTRNFSRRFPFKEYMMPLNKNSISGYVAINGRSLNIKDVNNIPEEHGLKYNDSFDKQIMYKTINMLVIPMKDYNGNTVGVLQLLNKKSSGDIKLEETSEFYKYIEDYTKEEEDIILSLASQAAILLERTILYNEIHNLFQSFIETMVATLDARDVTTSGHSKRLAGYAMKMVDAINNVNYGKYKDFKFTDDEKREIYYSALLHDVGKIGVKEGILLKRYRLSDDRMNVIRYRFNFLKKSLEAKKILGQISEQEFGILENIDNYFEFLFDINRKGYITDNEEQKINDIARLEFEDVDGKTKELLDEFEVENFTIRRGNLTDEERAEMNVHVTYTYDILQNIPWIKGLKEVPNIAGSHHEKIDGTGYPKGLKGDEIKVSYKILGMLDIFEALTARDRPYKPPMTIEKAISVLESEVKDGHLDKEMFDIFVNERVYEIFKEELNKIVKI